jgi:hypothetical protein
VSSTVLLRVTCDRCTHTEMVEPVAKAVAKAREYGAANASADQVRLHELEERPVGWGTVDWRRDAPGVNKFKRELCASCMETVRLCIVERP